MRFALALTALLSAAAASIGHANATCTYNSVATPSGVFALSGDVCTAAAGTYNPTVQPDVSLPPQYTYTGFGFFATNRNIDGVSGVGGVINSPNAVTINTTGANNAYGAWSDGTGAQINLGGGTTISTTGTNSFGLYASGGATISASAPVKVTASGTNTSGIEAVSGGTVTLSGASITSSRLNGEGVDINSGGHVTMTGGSVTTSGNGSAEGFAVNGTGSTLEASGVSVTTNGTTDPASGLYVIGLTVNSGSATFAGGSITTNGPSGIGASAIAYPDGPGAASISISGGTAIVTNGLGGLGLNVGGAQGSLSADGISVTTFGNVNPADKLAAVGAHNGSAPSAPSGGTLNLTNTTIVTRGVSASGVVTDSAGVTTLNGGSVSTSGDDAFGLDASGAGSSVTANGTAIATGVPFGETIGGANAHGVLADSGGAVTLNGGSVTTNGANAIGLYATGAGSSITTTNLDGTGPVTVMTLGANSPGVQADSGGAVTLNGGSVAVTGTGSVGLYATGTGSTINATDVAVSTAGSGLSTANAIVAASGAVVTVSGGSASTTGMDAYVAGATGVATLNLSGTTIAATGDGSGGLFANGTGSTVTGTGLSITTHGNYDSVNNFGPAGLTNQSYPGSPGGGVVTLTNSSILTTGTQATGVYTADGGTTKLMGDSVTTSGANSSGVFSDAGGTINVTGGSITTSNVESDAVRALSGAQVAVQGTKISTGGDGSGGGSKGFDIQGAGTIVTVNGVSVTTTGTINSATGDHSQGLYNGDGTHSGTSPTGGGVAHVTNSTFQTQGVDSIGVDTLDGGTTTLNGGSVSTTGVRSAGVVSDSSAFVSLTAVSVTTTGNGASGLAVNGGGELDATNATIATQGGVDPSSGAHAYGAYNGPSGSFTTGGVLKLTDTSISTQGVQMTGVRTGAGGTTSILGGSITTGGTQAAGVVAQNGAVVTIGESTIGGTTITTSGLQARGVDVETGGRVTMTGGSVTTSGDGSLAFEIAGTGSTLQATGVNLTTSGTIESSTGYYVVGLSLNDGGTASFTGGSITTKGASNTGAASESSSGSVTSVTLSGGTKILTTGLGSIGMNVSGANASITANGISITTDGDVNPTNSLPAIGAYNGNNPVLGISNGGTLNLTSTDVVTKGASAGGVVTNAGGVTNISGSSVTTSGQDAHALFVTGTGSTVNLSGSNTFATQGAGASGVVASLGGVVSATGSTSVTTSGGVSPATGFGANGVVADGAGAKVTLGATAIATSGPGGYALIAADSTASGSAGSISVTGALTVSTTNAAAAAVGLQGDGASIFAAGGGSITSAGDAIKFLGGSGQTATFDNFTINNLSGDLVFADPSTATVNFNSTTANAGSNNLLNAINGSAITFNASASTLTGAIRTDATSTTNVNLSNGTVWTMTGSSVVTNLAVTNSIVVFAPPSAGGGFKTLTVGSYFGSGANITMNAALGGSTQGADQIIVNGGSATGVTLLTIRNVSGLGGQTTGSGVPLVVTTNGGTIAPGAFALAGVPIFGGFRYMLDQSNGDLYLVSTPAPTVADVTNSVNNLAKAQQNQIITNRVLNSLLQGATQQISSCSCAGGFASVGSFAAGAQGRWSLSDELTLIGGFSYNQWNASGVTVDNAPTVAGALIYDFWKWGNSRPFLEAGGALTPYEDVSYSRSYANGDTWAVGNAKTIDRNLSLFARAGWIARLTPVDEAAVYGDLGRNWMQTGGYTEATSALNPFPATVPSGLDTLNVVRFGGQITHLFNGNIEANVSGAVAYGFGAGAGPAESVYGFGPIAPNALPNTTWVEYGARLGYRYSDRLVIDAFVVGTAFGEVGSTVHGGIGVRYSF